MRRPPIRTSGNRRGYTAVEVLLSMTVLSIGAAGVMSMQKAAVQGNADARKLDTANAIAHTWIDRLRTDGTAWTLPSTVLAAATTSNLPLTNWLGVHLDSGAFFLPTVPPSYPAEGLSPAFDIFGRDLDAADAPSAVFCTHIKVDTLQFDQSGTPGLPLILRATVIVFWAKSLVNSAVPNAGNCTSYFDVAHYESTNPGTYHIVYATSAIRKNPLQ
jgi:prepilin-type N-terminal cleavage/methylation domain-containing protein